MKLQNTRVVSLRCCCRYGRKMLRKFGYGPETEVIKSR